MRTGFAFLVLAIVAATLVGLRLSSVRGEPVAVDTIKGGPFEWTVKAFAVPGNEPIVDIVTLKATGNEISFDQEKQVVVTVPDNWLEGAAITLRNISTRTINEAKVEIRFRDSNARRYSALAHAVKGSAAHLPGVEPNTWIRPNELFDIPLIEPMAGKLRSSITAARSSGVTHVTLDIAVIEVVFDGLKDVIWRRDGWFRRDPANPRGFYRVDKVTSLQNPDKVINALMPLPPLFSVTHPLRYSSALPARMATRSNSAFGVFPRTPTSSSRKDGTDV